jgi:phenylpropionate dioxygenase-like ring-hydroxylating dioxygenase large terminal subunit
MNLLPEHFEAAKPAQRFDLRKVGAHPDHWYPVAWSHDVRAGKTCATSFAGEPIVLVRPGKGCLFALEDRCAHRQVPLSKGTVDGCTLRCCYHGWRYDAAGRCVDVPYLGKGKLPNGVRAYPCFERDGIIFVWPGLAPAAAPLERISAAADPAYKTRRFGKLVHCHYSFMHENLMDMNHQFLHQRTTGKVAPRYLGSRSGDGWIEVDYSFARPDQKPPLGEAVITGAWRGRSATARDLMTVRTEYPYQSLRMWTRSEDPVLSVWLGYTPTDTAQRRNRAFVVLSVRRPKIPGLLDVVWPVLAWFTGRVFAEDCEIVEMEQAAYDAQGEDRNQEVFPPIQKLRKLLQNCGRPLPR